MLYEEFERGVAKYDPDIGELAEILQEELSVEIASASASLFSEVLKVLGNRLNLIANARVATIVFGDAVDPLEDDIQQVGEAAGTEEYEFSEPDFQSAETHAREAQDCMAQSQIDFLRGMLKKAVGIQPTVSIESETRH